MNGDGIPVSIHLHGTRPEEAIRAHAINMGTWHQQNRTLLTLPAGTPLDRLTPHLTYTLRVWGQGHNATPWVCQAVFLEAHQVTINDQPGTAVLFAIIPERPSPS